MENNLNITVDTFGKLFVLAKKNKLNFSSFSKSLIKYNINFLKFGVSVESIQNVFEHITGVVPIYNDTYGVYDDAYWCAFVYSRLSEILKKPLAYIICKMPVDILIDMYGIYHEADISMLVDRFNEISKNATILRSLCLMNKISLSKLSKLTGINKNTLVKYNASDSALYKASFEKVYNIRNYFDVDYSLFIERTNI